MQLLFRFIQGRIEKLDDPSTFFKVLSCLILNGDLETITIITILFQAIYLVISLKRGATGHIFATATHK